MSKLRNYHSKEEIYDIFALGSDEAVKRLKGGVEHTPEEIAQFKRMIASRPEYARQVEATAAYAKERGGLTLKCWELLSGPWFGEPWIMTPAACVDELQVPAETIEEIMAETFAAVRERLNHEKP